MAWITLTLRKQEIKNQSNQFEDQDIQLSRGARALDRDLQCQKSLLQNKELREIKEARAEYDALKLTRPKMEKKPDGDGYNYYDADGNLIDEGSEDANKAKYDQELKTWNENFANVKEVYQTEKTEIEDLYDGMYEDAEEEATLRQSFIEEEQTYVETQLNAINQELNSINEQIKTDIQNTAVKFS